MNRKLLAVNNRAGGAFMKNNILVGRIISDQHYDKIEKLAYYSRGLMY